MAVSASQNISLNSTITVTHAGTGYFYRSSNTDSGSLSFSVSVPSGATNISATLYYNYNSSYSGAKVNGQTCSQGAGYIALGAVSSANISFSFKAFAESSQGGLPTATTTRTASWSAYLAVTWDGDNYSGNPGGGGTPGEPGGTTPPSEIWNLYLNGVMGATAADVVYTDPGAAATLSWSADDTNIAVWQIHRKINGGAYSYLESIAWQSRSATVYAASAGNMYQYMVLGIYSNNAEAGYAYSPTLISRSAVRAPTWCSVSPSTRYPGEGFALTWGGALGGAGTYVTGYHIYQNGVYLTATTSTNITITAPSTGSYAYQVYALSNISGYNSGASPIAALTVKTPYSACTAPTAVSTPTNVIPSTNYTLSWSGAGAGTENAITGYQVYRASTENGTYAAFGSTVTGTSLTVTSHATNGSSYYYKVVTIGTVSGYDSPMSTAYATMTTNVGVVTAPTTITAAPSIFADSVTLAWSGATAGTNNAITGYTVEYQTGDGTTWASTVVSSASTSSVIDTSALTRGHYLRFRVLTTGERSNSAYTAWSASARKNQLPPVPVVSYPKTGTVTYNPRPFFKTVLGTEPDGQAQTVEYSVDGGAYVSSSGGIIRISLAAGAHTIAFRTFDGLDGRSATASVTITVAATNYTDTIAKGTIVKAIHYNEVHACLNALCGYYGLVAWSGTVGTVVSATDLNAIQNKIASVALINSVPFAKLNFVRNMPILASDINYLRNAIQGL